MQESKPKSFEWLRNRDASEIIEIDIEGDFLPPSELLVENTTSLHDPPSRIQLDQIFSKLPKTLPKSQKSKEVTTLESTSKFPEWKGLCKEVSITSQESFDWLKNIDSEAESTGILEASQGVFSSIPSRAIYSGILYWGCEGLQENEWMPALRSIYYMYANRKTERFYVMFKRISCVFCREGSKAVVYVANPTPQLLINLRKALVNIPLEESEAENLVKVKSSKKNPVVKIEGKNVQAFYNYLVNNYSDSKIIASCVFLNAQLKSLTPTCNCEVFNPFEVPQQQFKLAFSGFITRQMIVNLCSVLEKTQNNFYIETVREGSSEQLPGKVPVKIQINQQRMYDITYD